MLEVLGLDVSAKMLVYLMLSFAFFVGIMLMVSKEAFTTFNKALQKEYGIKRRIAPQIEDSQVDIIDQVMVKYRILAGTLICLCSFILLMIYK